MQDSHTKIMDTILATDCRFEGKIHFKKKLVVKGQVDGEIVSDGQLIVYNTANIEANITVQSLYCQGDIKGSVTVHGLSHLLAGSKLQGSLRTKELHVDKTAILNGLCTMLPSSASEEATTPKRVRTSTKPRTTRASKSEPADEAALEALLTDDTQKEK